MTQITWETHAHGDAGPTTTWDIPSWAPDIADASTEGLLCWLATTSGAKVEAADGGDSVVPSYVGMASHSKREIRLADNQPRLPIAITLRYRAVGELVRT